MNRQYTKDDLQDMRLHYLLDFMKPFNVIIYKPDKTTSSINGNSIHISWNNVIDAKGYKVELSSGESITVDYNNQ